VRKNTVTSTYFPNRSRHVRSHVKTGGNNRPIDFCWKISGFIHDLLTSIAVIVGT
jgi:hypothetical protein